MGGDAFFGKVRSRTSGSGVGTNAGVTVTLSAPTGNLKYTVTGIQASGDAAAVVTVESPSGTVLYRKRFAAAFTVSESWPLGGLSGAMTQAALVKISASTANCEACIQAFVGG